MGIIDFLIRNSLFKSVIFLLMTTMVFSLVNIEYKQLINPFEFTSLESLLYSNSIAQNFSVVFQSIKTINLLPYLIVLIIGLLYINAHTFIDIISHYKEINMPYALNLYNPIRRYEWQDKQIKTSHDRFFKHNYNSIFYKNSIAIDIEKYESSKNAIIQYLNLPTNYEVAIKSYGNKAVQVQFFQLPTSYKFDELDYKKGHINIGYSKDGIYYINLLDITHLLVCGESGSGKSNLMHHLLKSIFINIDFVQTIEMIDLKGTELYRYIEHPKVNFIDTVEEVKERLLDIKIEMLKRFSEMKKNNDQLYNGQYIFLVIDEVGTIGSHPNKKVRDEIFALLIEIFQKGRASKIIGQIYEQKVTTDSVASGVLANCQSKILMKTDSDFNINNTIGTKEYLEKITRVDPDSFPRGRMIYKDGISSDKVLIQAPIIDFNCKEEPM